MTDWISEFLEEREEKYLMLQTLVALLYTQYQQDIRSSSLQIEPCPEPLVYKKTREIVDQHFPYYKGLSKKEFVSRFKTIIGNHKDFFDIPPAYFGQHLTLPTNKRDLQPLRVIEDD